MIKPGDKNNLAHYVLEVRPSPLAMQFPDVPTARYNGLGLFFCPAAGAEAPFATGRINLNSGEINPVTYEYFASLPYADFNYRYERS